MKAERLLTFQPRKSLKAQITHMARWQAARTWRLYLDVAPESSIPPEAPKEAVIVAHQRSLPEQWS